MATGAVAVANSDSDDEEINPVTMLQLDPDPSSNKSELIPTQIQHQTYLLTSVNSSVVIRQLPSQGLSFQLWPAATTFVNLLDSYNPSNSDSFSSAITHLKNRSQNSRLRVLELGSGTGVAGIAASAILGADVTVTDLSHVLPNLRFNVEANSTVVGLRGGEVHVAELNWGKYEDMEAVGREFDLVIGSDVVYYDDLYQPLIQTLKYLFFGEGENNTNTTNNNNNNKVFLMAHLKRWKKEGGFFKKARKWFKVEVVHEDGKGKGKSGEFGRRNNGVVVYRFVRKDAVFR